MGAGGGDVMHRARLHIRDPQREPAWSGHGLDVAAVGMRLAGVPQADGLASHADGRFFAPIAGDDLAVQDYVGKPCYRARSSAWRRSGAWSVSTSAPGAAITAPAAATAATAASLARGRPSAASPSPEIPDVRSFLPPIQQHQPPRSLGASNPRWLRPGYAALAPSR